MNWLFKSILFVVLVINSGGYLQAQNESIISDLYVQRLHALEINDKASLQIVNKQLIELNERPNLIYTKSTQNNIDVYEFVPAVNYSISDINKINTRFKNIIPALDEIKKVSDLSIKVYVLNTINSDDLKHIFSVFRYTFNSN